MKVEVVDARPQGAQVVRVELRSGATLRDALAAAGFDAGNHPVGIFGKRAPLDHPLADGDRVEIYRPLAIDPKEARRRRARKR
jgi:putative ubiquitin-RnfH superfamily antitoxin RatB of RatAB toxin-antitoxin module